MDLLSLINLVEQGSEPFYMHLEIPGQSQPAEMYWINNQWTFRPFAYQGEWVVLDSPLELEHLFDKRKLGLHLADFLLTEFYYYVVFPQEDKLLRKKIIENYFGKDRCQEYQAGMEEFQKALSKLVLDLTEPSKVIPFKIPSKD